MLLRTGAFAFLGLFACMSAWSEDVEIIPQGGAGFAVKNSANDSIRFKVNESGEVIIPSLPANMAGKPLCWDKTTGILRQCPEGAGTDFVPPTIEVDAPAVAMQAETEVVVRIEDNVELSHLIGQAYGDLWYQPGESNLISSWTRSVSGTKKEDEYREFFQIGLNSLPTSGTYIVSDTSGNTAKTEWVIRAPKTVIPIGDYDISGSVVVPTGFDCLRPVLPNYMSEDGLPLARLASRVGGRDGCSWSVALGYCMWFDVAIEVTASTWITFDFNSPEKIALDAKIFSQVSDIREVYDGTSENKLSYRYDGTFEAIDSESSTIQATIIKQCNIYGTGWIDGIPLSFTARLPE